MWVSIFPHFLERMGLRFRDPQHVSEAAYLQLLQSRDLLLPQAGGDERIFERMMRLVEVEIVDAGQRGQADVCHLLLQVFLPWSVLQQPAVHARGVDRWVA